MNLIVLAEAQPPPRPWPGFYRLIYAHTAATLAAIVCPEYKTSEQTFGRTEMLRLVTKLTKVYLNFFAVIQSRI